MQIAVLGAGLVGSAIARDLARGVDYSITAVDLDEQVLGKLEADSSIRGIKADLREAGRVADIVADCDLVICAVPGFMGFETVKRVIEAGKNVVDISFFGEDPFLLDDLAESRGVTAVVDCGVAPGLSNIIAGHVGGLLDHIHSYACYVGGLPRIRQWPYEYKTFFSPSDVLEEYTRPVRFVEYGKEVVHPALSDVQLFDFPGVGTLEAFDTDGLRTLMRTMDIPFMREKTLRYPGHANLMRVFREGGFFSTDPIEVAGRLISPLDLTCRLLFERWRMGEWDEDFTVMQVVIEGQKKEKWVHYKYFLLDRYDRETRTTSMARTTGYTCAIVARQILNGLFNRKGVCAPEFIGRARGCFEDLLEGYAERNIELEETVTSSRSPESGFMKGRGGSYV